MERARIVYSGKFSRNNQIQCSSFSSFGDEHALTSRRKVIKTNIFRKLQTLWTFVTLVWDAEDKYILGIKIKIY